MMWLWKGKLSLEKKKIKISVRRLIEFILQSGDIDRRHSAASRDAMQEGSRIHRKIQKRMGADYQAEVPLRHVVDEERYELIIEGRADGIIRSKSGEVTVDEIKGVYCDLSRLKEPDPLHLAQALCYAYFYCCSHSLSQIRIQVTYCNMESEEIRRFLEERSLKQLEEWFSGLMREYRKWAQYRYEHGLRREASLKALEFPYGYREGQRGIAVSVYRAIAGGRNLFIQAPTGIGKTLSTVFPSLKAIGEGRGEKLFYLTAKTITRSAAEGCFSLLRERGLYFSTITITAREKLCLREKPECNPDACPYARGHFDRVNDAVFAIIQEESVITLAKVEEYALRFRVCPYEFCLDISTWVDGVICDYNYVFDPNVRLRRYFSDAVSGGYIFLIDEAHNLVSRAREMFSASIVKEDILAVRGIVKSHPAFKRQSTRLVAALSRCNRRMLEYKRGCERFEMLDGCDILARELGGLCTELEEYLEDEQEPAFEKREEVLRFYFNLRHFLNMHDSLDGHYKIYTELREDGNFLLKLFCIDPSARLKECLKKGNAAIFFSATLLPVIYYKKLLSGNAEECAVYVPSPFPQENRQLLIGTDVSSRYTRRNQAEYARVVSYIYSLAQSHKGNYMVFFPSYQYMEAVGELLPPAPEACFEWKMQTAHMSEPDREAFLAEFDLPREGSFVAFCVLGGIFSEGIDLKAERLEGAVIVGTGIPKVCTEQEVLKAYFDEQGEDGYSYAYQYPGMNKVLQSAGRVIRTPQDRGVILLLDDRFLREDVQSLFPREWSQYARVTQDTVAGWLKHFWG